MAKVENPKFRKATFSQIIEIGKLLENHLHPVEGMEGIFEYDDGWSDKEVADEVGCSVVSVSNTRKSAFGQLRARSPLSDNMKSRIEEVERQMGVVLQGIEGLQSASDDPEAPALSKRVFDLSQQLQTTRNRLAETVEALRDLQTRHNGLCERLQADTAITNIDHLRVSKRMVG